MKHIVVIGGGIAGLAAAYKVKRAAEAGNDVSFTLIEKSDRLGGKIASDVTDDGFVVDGGCDSFLTEKPAIHRLAGLMGIEDQKLSTDESLKGTWIMSRGKLHKMPDGIMMFAPTKFLPFATTTLFSWPGKFRAGMDLFIPRKVRWKEGETARDHDETLESFVLRRMGRDILDHIAEPLVGGVHASDPAYMSLAATYPRLLEMEQKFGSMIGGFVDARRKVAAMKKKYPPKPGEKRRTFFTSFNNGMQQFTDSLADFAGRDHIRTGVGASGVTRDAGGWKVALDTGEVLDADGVIICTEGWAASALTKDIDAAMSATIGEIKHSSSATVILAFDTTDVGFDTRSFGVLLPIVERRRMMAATYSSTKWPGRAPAGKTLMRGFVGGPQNQKIMDNDDEALTRIVVNEFRDILGLKAEPIWTRVYRWTMGMPQYGLGHLDRVDAIEAACDRIPGLGIGGGSYRGIGIPNCVESGEKAVSKVLGEWGITLSEDSVEEKRLY
jgi:protoporphyrinogen/coproporphyrinogen III oxidase